MTVADRVLANARIATMRDDSLGLIEDGAILCRGGEIAWVGPTEQLPAAARGAERIDCGGKLVTPGLIDCHTHLVFAGNRAHEFELRLTGVSYEKIAQSGGGIVSTVAATRAADQDTLTRQSEPRLCHVMIKLLSQHMQFRQGHGSGYCMMGQKSLHCTCYTGKLGVSS